jgi:predicted ATPase
VPFFEARLRMMHGETSSVVKHMRQGIDDYRASGAVVWSAYFTVLLSEAMEHQGQATEALSLLDTEFATVHTTGEFWCLSEICRRRGELCLRQSKLDPAASEQQFLHGIEIAKRQSAKWWELRCATSLARLWSVRDKRARARDLLIPVYSWFTEGFGTPDLRKARELLATLV